MGRERADRNISSCFQESRLISNWNNFKVTTKNLENGETRLKKTKINKSNSTGPMDWFGADKIQLVTNSCGMLHLLKKWFCFVVSYKCVSYKSTSFRKEWFKISEFLIFTNIYIIIKSTLHLETLYTFF